MTEAVRPSSFDERHSTAAAPHADWFGHPRGLTFLFLTEMWEVFSLQGMRALLVYYLTRQLLFAQADASTLYGIYTACLYLTPIAGGMIADRWLGHSRAVVLGGSIMAVGHFMMASEALVHVALAVIVCGNGFFLPSLASQIGGLYEPRDPRRDGAYSVYYVGKNVGALLAPLGCGTVGELFGWHWGFGLAGAGMVVGLAAYLCGRKYLPIEPRSAQRKATSRSLPPRASGPTLWICLLAVALAVAIFRCAYEQMGNTFALWVDGGVDRTIAGDWSIPMTWFQSLNPTLVFLFTPALIWHWTRRTAARRESSPIAKMALGAFLLAAGYMVLAGATLAAEADSAPVSVAWVILFVMLYTLGELHVLPIGLGLFGRLAPPALMATVLAAWYLTSFVGNLAAGQVGRAWSRLSPPEFFLSMGALACVSGVILFALRRPLRAIERCA
jgi:POT family proton-dependent oligopeptide transporter